MLWKSWSASIYISWQVPYNTNVCSYSEFYIQCSTVIVFKNLPLSLSLNPVSLTQWPIMDSTAAQQQNTETHVKTETETDRRSTDSTWTEDCVLMGFTSTGRDPPKASPAHVQNRTTKYRRHVGKPPAFSERKPSDSSQVIWRPHYIRQSPGGLLYSVFGRGKGQKIKKNIHHSWRPTENMLDKKNNKTKKILLLYYINII